LRRAQPRRASLSTKRAAWPKQTGGHQPEGAMGAAALTGDQHKAFDCRDRRIKRAGAARGRAWGDRDARAAALLALACLSGCATTPPPDDVTTKITQYYAEHANEEGGRCVAPEIASVTKRKVLGSSGEVTHLRVRYSYFDAGAPGATDWTRVLQAPRACTGVAERDFTLVSTDLGYKVLQMSGPVREQP
jgi:hypothetical protein